MKVNKKEGKGRKRAQFAAAVIVLLALIAGLGFGYQKLCALYHDQCVLTKPAEQISIFSGKLVKPDVIAENLGLKAGVNLADIDFQAKRAEILKKIPTLRNLSIAWVKPDRLKIVAEERSPIAKLAIRNQRGVSGRVVDTEGMVFICQRGTQMLPTIRESSVPGVQAGNRITGRTLAALRLVETCRERTFLELGVLEVDTTKPDFLVMTLSNYSRVKIAWESMDAPNERSRPDLINRLDHLLKAIHSKIGTGTVIWNATMPDMIFADNQKQL